MHPNDILHFWFEELSKEQWFKKDPALDSVIAERFGVLHREVAEGHHDDWAESAEGALALVLVLDQFSRNMFRDTPEAFAYDECALALAESAVEEGKDKALPESMRAFLYMPFMHSESKEVHERALPLFASLKSDSYLKYEKLHKQIIDRFSRYPHRNAILGRTTTEEERHFLENKEHSSF